jgi:hypothetical protein
LDVLSNYFVAGRDLACSEVAAGTDFSFTAQATTLAHLLDALSDVMKTMASDVAIAHAQLAQGDENLDWMTPEIAQTYFGPLAATPERAELLRGFGAALNNRDQMVALAPRLRESNIPV